MAPSSPARRTPGLFMGCWHFTPAGGSGARRQGCLRGAQAHLREYVPAAAQLAIHLSWRTAPDLRSAARRPKWSTPPRRD